MALYTLADLHLAADVAKPMDIFGGRWQGHTEKIIKNWRALVAPEDTIVLGGDISWGINLAEAKGDFALIDSLPGKKIILKGNHDLWWETASKMHRFLDENGFTTIDFLHNNCFFYEKTALCGTRGWLAGQPDAHSGKVYAREVGRLCASLAHAQAHYPLAERVAVLHYPPVYGGGSAREMLDVLAQYGVKRCFYGHLHAASIRRAAQGSIEGEEYRLISADALQFCPYKI